MKYLTEVEERNEENEAKRFKAYYETLKEAAAKTKRRKNKCIHLKNLLKR